MCSAPSTLLAPISSTLLIAWLQQASCAVRQCHSLVALASSPYRHNSRLGHTLCSHGSSVIDWLALNPMPYPTLPHPMTTMFACSFLCLQEEATSTDVLALTALAGGMVAASCCLWYYSRRYVGEMALMMPDAQRVRFSVLDFWGNREVRGV